MFQNYSLDEDIQYIKSQCASELSILKGKNILFTGPGGFIGYLFTHTLLEICEDYNISLTLVDNFIRGKMEWLKNLEKNTKIEIINADITKPINYSKNFDYIIHAASIASPTFYRKYPIETIDSNVNGIRNLLELSKNQYEKSHPISGLLFFSSSEIYGDPSADAIPTPETYRGIVSCTGPRACYDESKRLGETLCVSFHQQYNIPVKVVRPFNNYGPGLNIKDRRLLPDLFNNVFRDEDITLLSDGNATRTFCYISDAISGYIKALVNGTSGEAYNIGQDQPEIKIKEIADMVVIAARKELNYNGKVVFDISNDKHYLTDNPNRRCPDITKSRKELNFNPSINIEEGINKSLLWYKENYI